MAPNVPGSRPCRQINCMFRAEKGRSSCCRGCFGTSGVRHGRNCTGAKKQCDEVLGLTGGPKGPPTVKAEAEMKELDGHSGKRKEFIDWSQKGEISVTHTAADSPVTLSGDEYDNMAVRQACSYVDIASVGYIAKCTTSATNISDEQDSAIIRSELFWRSWPTVSDWIGQNWEAALIERHSRRMKDSIWKAWVEEAAIFPPPLVSSSEDDMFSEDDSDSDEESVKKEVVEKELVKEESVKKEVVMEELVKEESVKKEVVKKELVKEESVKEESVSKLA